MSCHFFSVHQSFITIKTLWRYIPKILLILASISSLITLFALIIFRSNFYLQLHNTPCITLTFPKFLSPNFLEYLKRNFLKHSVSFINFLFNNFIVLNFSLSLHIFIDGSVSSSSTCYFSLFLNSVSP